MKKSQQNIPKKLEPELLAPAGNFESLEAALYFGADAVYFAGKEYSLRAGADNFDAEGLKRAVEQCHKLNKKAYIACNIFAHNHDFDRLPAYFSYLKQIQADALIVSDPGVLSLAKIHAAGVPLHLSTQANTTNRYSAQFWAEQGVERIVLSRELSVDEICEIRDALPPRIELEAFVHGAMCVSYSGRCLLSNFMTGRSGNRGACTQSCRWEYEIREVSREGEYLTLTEDRRGAYILNSRDMNCLSHLDKLLRAGITSFKIEGRNKSAYYVANVVNAYRRALDIFMSSESRFPEFLEEELYKSAHRKYFSGFYFGDMKNPQSPESASPEQTHRFVALVTGAKEAFVEIEQRNRFSCGDELEVLSPSGCHNQKILVTELLNEQGDPIHTANLVQQKLYLKTTLPLQKGDMLRIRI